MINSGPKRFIECLLPVTSCNLKCEYCYIIQESRRTNIVPKLKYSPEHICKALSKERLGGICYISICGAGETLLPDYVINIVHGLLKEGHYVNVTTNGTLQRRFLELLNFDKSLLKHLHIAFSFHYLELKNKGLIDVFFDNVNLVKNAGCSFLVQFNLYDGYLPYLDEIKNICIERTGALPQVAATRDESSRPIKLHTNLSREDYQKTAKDFESPLFDFTMKNFNVKRKEFCYAGDWSFLLNLETGVMSKCYANTERGQNIFENLNEPIRFEAIGNNCKNDFCVNSSHFLSLGVIPSLLTPTYESLRNRRNANWYSKDMTNFLSKKLIDNNSEYSKEGKKRINHLYKPSLIKKIINQSKRLAFFIIRTIVFFIKYYRISSRFCYFVTQFDHSNIGDAAIALSQLEIVSKLRHKAVELNVRTFNKYEWFIKRFLNSPNRYFLLQGGGNMGNIWLREENQRRKVLASLDNAKMIIFPQTIFYDHKINDHSEIESIQFYNNERITLFVREKYSLELAKKLYPRANIKLVPDTVLISHDYVETNDCNRDGVLFVMRNDCEKITDSELIKQIENKLKEDGETVNWTDMHFTGVITKKDRKEIVVNKIREFQSHKLVITDRLHGMIFAAITGTPCIVLENANYKIKGSFEWINDSGKIFLVKDHSDLKQKLALISDNKTNFNDIDLTKFIESFRF